jgi:hypothetical protein
VTDVMNSNTMRNLTMASAKHLLSQGHISKPHHAKIMAKAGSVPGAPKPPALGAMAPAPKVPKMTAMAPPAVPMGALDATQPKQGQGAGHYMSTPTPVGADEDGGGGA